MSSTNDASQGPPSKKQRVDQPVSRSRFKAGETAIVQFQRSGLELIPNYPDSSNEDEDDGDDTGVFRLFLVTATNYGKDNSCWMCTGELSDEGVIPNFPGPKRILSVDEGAVKKCGYKVGDRVAFNMREGDGADLKGKIGEIRMFKGDFTYKIRPDEVVIDEARIWSKCA